MYLCEFVVACRAGQTQQALPLLRVLVDASALIQQLAHGIDVSVRARLGQATAKNNQTATITATVQVQLLCVLQDIGDAAQRIRLTTLNKQE